MSMEMTPDRKDLLAVGEKGILIASGAIKEHLFDIAPAQLSVRRKLDHRRSELRQFRVLTG